MKKTTSKTSAAATLKAKIRTVPHWPKKGVMFRDITTLLKDAAGLRVACEQLAARFKRTRIDVVAGIESRGFIFGSVVAFLLGKGFVPFRKPGKLPAPTVSQTYKLEYGTDKIEVHKDAIKKGTRVLVVDDLIATGGTVKAVCQLIEKLGGVVVGCAFVIELPDLGGRAKLKGYTITALTEFEGD